MPSDCCSECPNQKPEWQLIPGTPAPFHWNRSVAPGGREQINQRTTPALAAKTSVIRVTACHMPPPTATRSFGFSFIIAWKTGIPPHEQRFHQNNNQLCRPLVFSDDQIRRFWLRISGFAGYLRNFSRSAAYPLLQSRSEPRIASHISVVRIAIYFCP